MILQLSPTIPLVCSKGTGFAHFILDYGQEHHTLWGIFIDRTGEFWWVPNYDVKLQENWSMGVTGSKPQGA